MEAKYDEGKLLITDPSDRAFWPQFLNVISGFFPDPERGIRAGSQRARSPRTPSRNSASTSTPSSRCGARISSEWFTETRPEVQDADASHRRKERAAPTGEGWIVQLVCHHYNPYPDLTNREPGTADADPRRTVAGPLVRFNSSRIRCYRSSISRAPPLRRPPIAVAWLDREPSGPPKRGPEQQQPGEQTRCPLLDRASVPPGTGDSGSSGGGAVGGAVGAAPEMRHDECARQSDEAARRGWRHGEANDPADDGGRTGTRNDGNGNAGRCWRLQDMKMLTRTDFLLHSSGCPR